MDKKSPVDAIYKKYNFSWEVLDTIIGGKSILDNQEGLTGFPLQTLEEAGHFVRSYGFDLDDPIEQAEVLGNFHEAVNFIRKTFLTPENPEGLRLEIPRKILELQDMRHLLMLANMSFPNQQKDSQGFLMRDWACALLKVIHTIVHLDKDIRYHYFSEIQKQIFDRFYKAIHRDDSEKLFLGDQADDPQRVDLIAFETKPKKARESLLLKLLHKPESVSDEIFDQVGLRFVTGTPLDALRVIKKLKDKMVVMPANIKPSRSRNSLIDMEVLKNGIEPIFRKVDEGEWDEKTARAALEGITVLPDSESMNPHSSEYYRGLQFTCRQLIKLRNPAYEPIRDLKKKLKDAKLDEEILKSADQVDLKYLQREVRFFYPYELQIFDRESYEENEKGRSAHSEYKKSQVQTALRRVMGNLVRAQKQPSS